MANLSSKAIGLTVLLLQIMMPEVSWGEELSKSSRNQPSFLTPYDFATAEDLLYYRLVHGLVDGDQPANWPLLEDFASAVGEWVNDFISAERIASAITTGMPIEGQENVRELDEMVADCAKILHVPNPVVFLRNSPVTVAYTARVNDRAFLVLTSGLLNLYDGKPDELRFIIGHELGHLKCEHDRLRVAAYGVLAAVRSVNRAAIPDQYQQVLPTLGFGRLCTWARESEITADRAGLLPGSGHGIPGLDASAPRTECLFLLGGSQGAGIQRRPPGPGIRAVGEGALCQVGPACSAFAD